MARTPFCSKVLFSSVIQSLCHSERSEESRIFLSACHFTHNQRMASPAKFAFVLYRPQSAGNIGAVARALKNMGFDDLRLVGRGPLNDREAVKMAVHADDLLANATVYPSLADALADCSLAVGTTSRRGGYRSR